VPEAQVRELRQYVGGCISDKEFLAEAIEKDIGVRDSAPGLGSFDGEANLGVRFGLCYWAPGRVAGVHEHSDWTVTAVVHNQLEVFTYDLPETVRTRKVVSKNRFTARVGEVGHIYEHAIHNPANPTKAWAVSFHVLTVSDHPMLESMHGPIEGLNGQRRAIGAVSDPLRAALQSYQRECVRRVQIDILRSCGQSGVRAIDQLCSRGDSATRWHARVTSGLTKPLDLLTRLTRRWNEVQLQVVQAQEGAELRAVSSETSCTLVKADHSAAAALAFVACAQALCPSEIPGLDVSDGLRLAHALVSWGIFGPEGT
jgi:hypothetical protein